MPHVIIEYAQDAISDNQVNPLIEAVYSSIVETNIFDKNNIKIRAVPCLYYKVGEGARSFLHTQLRIQPGRHTEKKQKLSAAVLVAIRDMALKIDVITAEVIDMDKSSYSKIEM